MRLENIIAYDQQNNDRENVGWDTFIEGYDVV